MGRHNIRDALSVTTKSFPQKIKDKLTPIHGSFNEFKKRKIRDVHEGCFYIAKSQADSETALDSNFQFQNRLRMRGYIAQHYPTKCSNNECNDLSDDLEAKSLIHQVLKRLETE